MGITKKNVEIDRRLLDNEDFFDFFSDYYEAEKEKEMLKMIETSHIILLDDPMDFRTAMGDTEYVDKVYREYMKRNA